MSEISKVPVSDFDAAVRLLSGGTNVAIYNDLGLPSIYVRKDKGLISDVISGGSATTHHAFKVNGVEVPAFYMGKYLATVYKGRALSLPMMDPAANAVLDSNKGSAASNKVSFENAKLWCEANGAGFHLPTIAEYAWVALLSRKNGTMPHGNNGYGKDSTYVYEKGVGSLFEGDKVLRTLTGSGPATWNDNHRPDGICDLNGNVYEYQGGYRTVDGELQIFVDNDAAMQYEQNDSSTHWMAILQDGSLVEPGTAGTIKWDYTKDPGTGNAGSPYCLNTVLNHQQTVGTPYGIISFANLTAADGIIIPERLKALALMPDGTGVSYGSDYVYTRNVGERLAFRGGSFGYGGDAGVFSVDGSSMRGSGNQTVGFRTAFIPGI